MCLTSLVCFTPLECTSVHAVCSHLAQVKRVEKMGQAAFVAAVVRLAAVTAEEGSKESVAERFRELCDRKLQPHVRAAT